MSLLAYERHTLIRAEPARVFRFCSDLRNEMVWNPRAQHVEKLTPGLVAAGTRFRARWANAGQAEVRLTAYDPPRAWVTSSRARGLDVQVRGEVLPEPTGSRYRVRLALHPTGLARVYAPLALLAMRRQEATNMRLITHALEQGHPTA